MAGKASGKPVGRKYNLPCLIAQSLDVVGDRWTLLILRDLMAGLDRYSDILESCHGMSPNILSNRLKALEAEGLVERRREKGLPPKVTYTLTEKGWSVRPVLISLMAWGLQHTNSFSIESVGTEISTDFFVRVVPALSFQPERASDMHATLVVEIEDCDTCDAWNFTIENGHLLPGRHAIDNPDIRLKTDTRGFFDFVRGEQAPANCGQLEGCPDLARSVQDCFAVPL